MSKKDLLRDHEFDGIQEFDNRLPNWWLWTLYGSIIFGLLYWLVFHTWRVGDLSRDRYAHEMAVAAEAQLARMAGQEVTDETLLLMSQVPERVQSGAAVFAQVCVTCHRPDGSGDVGPNLTDEYWLHGGRPTEILHTVTNGIEGKGMVAWEPQLGPRRVQDVVSYVLTIRGKNLPGKEPQGELFSGDEEPAPSDQQI